MVVDEDRVAELERRTHELSQRLERLERAPGDVALGPEAVARTARPRPRPLPPPAPVRPSPRTPPRPRLDLARMEALIGGRVIAWLGGAAVVLGLALLASVAASHGWIGPAARTGVAALSCVVLTGLGLFVVRQAIPRRALIATGVAGGFVTACLAGPVYGLVPGAVAALAGVAIGAAATALALRLPSRGIAALGLLGGLAAPLLTGAAGSAPSTAIALAAAAAAAVVLVWQRWNWLRAGLAALALPQVALYALLGDAPLAAALLALALLGVTIALAAIGYELRVRAARPQPASALLLVAGAAAVAVAGWLACADAHHEALGHLWLAGVAVACAASGLALRRPRPDLGLLLIAAAVVLADVGAASMTGGVMLGLLWSASVAVAALIARRAGSDHERLLALTGLAGQVVLAVAHALVSVPPAQLLDGPGAAATAELAVVVVALALGARLVAPLVREGAWVLEAAALALLVYLTVALASDLGLVLALAAQALAIDALARHDRHASAVIRHAAPLFLGAAGVAAALTVAPPDALMVGFADPLPAAAAMGAVALAGLRIARHAVATAVRHALTAGAAVALIDLGSGVVAWAAPTDQAGPLAVSALWALTGLGALVAGLAIGRRALRVAGLALLLVTTAKVFLVDLTTLTSVYRVTSFVAVGLLLLLGAVAWQRAAARTTT